MASDWLSAKEIYMTVQILSTLISSLDILFSRICGGSLVAVAVVLNLPSVPRRTATDAHLSELRLVPVLSSDIARWRPLRASPGLQVLLAVHEVHVLQTEHAGFVEEEPDE